MFSPLDTMNRITVGTGIALVAILLRVLELPSMFHGEPDLAVASLGQGLVRESATIYRTAFGRRIHSFLGIPYGQASRFQRAVIHEPWPGIFSADQHIECTQLGNYGPYLTTGQEDCLVVNVYSTDVKANRPVMVWIHGGSFNSGSSTPRVYGPEYLMERDVVLVTVNYRLGPLGFLGTGSDLLPGNLGLWDQKLALQWVQQNIANFGGDSQKVTLFGQSSGGIMVSYHVLSPQSHGLFQAAIIQSGMPTLPFGKSDEHPGFYAKKLAHHFQCGPNFTDAQMSACLTKVNADRLILAAKEIFTTFLGAPFPFKPALDNSTRDPFFHADPFETLERGNFSRVPLLIGNNQDEGLIVTSSFIREPALWSQFRDYVNETLPLICFGRARHLISSDDLNYVHILERSSGNIYHNFTALTHFVGNEVFQPLETMGMSYFHERNPEETFFYRYAHQNSYGITDIIAQPLTILFLRALSRLIGFNPFALELGVGHGDELFLLFKPHVIPLNTRYTRADLKASHNLLEVWVSFATNHRLVRSESSSHHGGILVAQILLLEQNVVDIIQDVVIETLGQEELFLQMSGFLLQWLKFGGDLIEGTWSFIE
eukprot:maker-scaffold1087_size63509-snap-gene-0.13 protein:Tk11010 transcript:maker-scaffold1087_size63509-snap-gene-0.13-mRNA-1 annotation:"hypothetical protein DAPPUDRAFT_305141"